VPKCKSRRGPLILIVVAFGIPYAAFAAFPEFRESLHDFSTGPGVANHPIGVRPSGAIQVPADWPLGADGSLTCMTCHSTLPAGKNAGSNLRGGHGHRKSAKAFCTYCHQDSGTGTAVHWQAVREAHVSAQDNRSTAQLSYEAGSQSCLACHDGVAAKDAAHSSIQSSGFGDRSRSHPVEVHYPMAGKMRSEVPLRPASSVPATISLAGGVVSCLSCHNLYSPDPQRLSVPIEGSQLCFACHDLN
jgi:predicted CXXCH cytochrome family protein